MLNYPELPSIPISALQHYMYCARQCALILVDGVWMDNRHTVRGQQGHRRSDRPSRRMERGRTVVRSVPVWSERLSLVGRADVVEVHANGRLVPGEIKMGRRHGITADVQLCAIAFCLEEMLGVAVTEGFIWYGGPRRRVLVRLDHGLRAMTMDAIVAVKDLLKSPRLPPAHDDRRCQECQLQPHCLPTVVAEPTSVLRYLDRYVRSCYS